MRRSKKSKRSENKSRPEPAAGLEASTKTRESKEPEDLPTTPQRQVMTATPKSEEATDNDSFEDFYLQQITHEFADDLDKIRKASDFKERSLPVLVAALKQGASSYSEEERRGWVVGHTTDTAKKI